MGQLVNWSGDHVYMHTVKQPNIARYKSLQILGALHKLFIIKIKFLYYIHIFYDPHEFKTLAKIRISNTCEI